MIKTIKGDLIELAFAGEFDIIAHGCNCQGIMGAGIAAQIKQHIPGAAKADKAYKKAMNDVFDYNHPVFMLGTLSFHLVSSLSHPMFAVANLYTQVQPGANFDLNYGLVPALKKLNYIHRGRRIGLPMIGAGIGGGDWNQIKEVIPRLLDNCEVTIVEYEPKQ